jgi:ATP-dependent protease HslVU (ClpYQ) peptidase subunit
MGQLLQHVAVFPEPPKDVTLKFMVSEFVESIRDCFKTHGYSQINMNEESAGCFIVGVNGKLFHVESDYQVNEYIDGFTADGSGVYYALGAMEALYFLDPIMRINRSIEIAAKFNPFVCLPITVIEATP